MAPAEAIPQEVQDLHLRLFERYLTALIDRIGEGELQLCDRIERLLAVEVVAAPRVSVEPQREPRQPRKRVYAEGRKPGICPQCNTGWRSETHQTQCKRDMASAPIPLVRASEVS